MLMWLNYRSQNQEIILDYLGGLNLTTRVLIRGRQEVQSQRGDNMIDAGAKEERFESVHLGLHMGGATVQEAGGL